MARLSSKAFKVSYQLGGTGDNPDYTGTTAIVAECFANDFGYNADTNFETSIAFCDTEPLLDGGLVVRKIDLTFYVPATGSRFFGLDGQWIKITFKELSTLTGKVMEGRIGSHKISAKAGIGEKQTESITITGQTPPG